MAGVIDKYQNAVENRSDPPSHAALCTPSDSADLVDGNSNPIYTLRISFVTAGDLKVTTIAGETLVIPSGALSAGVMHTLRVKRIWSTGTAAIGIVVYW